MLNSKIQELIKSNENLLDKLFKREPVIIEKKKTNPLLILLSIIGAVSIVFAFAFVFTRLFLDQDFDDYDDFDDLFEEDDEEMEAVVREAIKNTEKEDTVKTEENTEEQ